MPSPSRFDISLADRIRTEQAKDAQLTLGPEFSDARAYNSYVDLCRKAWPWYTPQSFETWRQSSRKVLGVLGPMNFT